MFGALGSTSRHNLSAAELYSIYACKHSSTPLVSDCRFLNFIRFVYLEQEPLEVHDLRYSHIPYLREKGLMGGAPYIGSRQEDGPIFEVSLSQLDAKERPGKLPTQFHYLNSSCGHY